MIIRESKEEGVEFYDVFDTKTEKVIGWYTKEDTDKSGMNYGYGSAKELADYEEEKANRLGTDYRNGTA
tara:strand:- start:177 stop:383 length:207 start_codon:yes stop_codon:yes gene_type:complete